VAITPGNPAIEYTNNFGLYLWAPGQTASGNTIGTNPPATNMDTRGLSMDLVEFPGGGTSPTLATNNIINVLTTVNNTEYGGCAPGGAYGIQYDDGEQNASDTLNTVNAFSIACPATGLRVTTIKSGNSSSNNVYKGILCSIATCGVNATASPTPAAPVTGGYFDSTAAAPAFVSTNDSFIGDGASITIDSAGAGPTYFQNPTLGSGSNPSSYNMIAFWNNSGGSGAAATQIYFIDPVFTGLASRTSTSMQVGDNAPYDLAQYFIQWTYSGTVKGAVSGNPLVGALVTVTAAAGAGGGMECAATTTTGGAFSCSFVSPTSVNQLTEMDMKNSSTATLINTSHNPHSVVVSDSGAGCTTNTSSLSITSTTTGVVISLAGC
jgi:hypothetical protein